MPAWGQMRGSGWSCHSEGALRYLWQSCTGCHAGGKAGSTQATNCRARCEQVLCVVQVHGGLCVSAVFHFNQAGQVTRLTTADRPR